MAFHVPERNRVRRGRCHSEYARYATDEADGNNGLFFVCLHKGGPVFKIIACQDPESGWEHVSVSLPDRCPLWKEMCALKTIFWDEEDAVMQLHPAKSDYVNVHPFCLHLWRPTKERLPLPPREMV